MDSAALRQPGATPSRGVASIPPDPAALPTIVLRGLGVHAITEARCVSHILDELDAGRGGWVATANLDHLRRLDYDRCFREIYSAATLVVADGMPLVWASRIQGTPLPERVAGSNLVSSLSEAAAKRGRSVFLLGGGTPETAPAAAAALRGRYPGLSIAGSHYPPFGFEKDAPAVHAIGSALLAANPDLVYVALGSPKQEELIFRIRHLLPRAWWLGVGISLSFLAGEVPRAPLWGQRLGLEWLHRLIKEPRRLARRYIIDGLPFAATLLGEAMIVRLRAPRGVRIPQRRPARISGAEPLVNRKSADH